MIESLVLLSLKGPKGQNQGIAYASFEISYMGCCEFTPLVSMHAGEKKYGLCCLCYSGSSCPCSPEDANLSQKL